MARKRSISKEQTDRTKAENLFILDRANICQNSGKSIVPS